MKFRHQIQLVLQPRACVKDRQKPLKDLLAMHQSCFHNPNFGFVVQIAQLLFLKNKLVKFYNIYYLVHIIKFSFYLFMFKDFSHPNSSKLSI